ncbi:hypothetical protein [Yoonia sp. 208BN28-4]|uniref:hypothetical protein n=1 Tax=Yoonia sp. 208BN28-4 TaxID=3126505 RepID=UPI0030951472
MKVHLVEDTTPSKQTAKIIHTLHDLRFEVVATSPEAPRFREPAVLIWSKNGRGDHDISEQELATLAEAGRLISVLVEKTTLPETLPKHPVVDLSGWRGSPRNAFFEDFRNYLEAASQRTPPPPPRGPLVRFVQRMCAGLTIGVIIAFVFGFALNLLELQNNLCSINFNQPNVSDFCGKYGLGDKPTKEERLAWEGREPDSCEALRAHIEKFGETGAKFDRASAMLDARRILTTENWTPRQQQTPFSQSINSAGFESETLAREDALTQASTDAEVACGALGESDFFRITGSSVEPLTWDCFTASGSHYCGFDGTRTCELEQLERTTTEICGPLP